MHCNIRCLKLDEMPDSNQMFGKLSGHTPDFLPFEMGPFLETKNCMKKTFSNGLWSIPMAKTQRHDDVVAETENVLRTVFVYINENSFNNCVKLSESIGWGRKMGQLKKWYSTEEFIQPGLLRFQNAATTNF